MKRKQVLIGSVLAGVSLIAALILVLLARTSSPPSRSIVETIPASVLSPAKRTCPIGMGMERGSRIVSRVEMVRLMKGHVPKWLPPGFGVSGAWTGTSGSAWILWSDQHCHSVNVTYTQGARGPSSWRLDYNKPHACGNYVMGMGTCIGYSVSLPGGEVTVQAIGLPQDDAARLVRSIEV